MSREYLQYLSSKSDGLGIQKSMQLFRLRMSNKKHSLIPKFEGIS